MKPIAKGVLIALTLIPLVCSPSMAQAAMKWHGSGGWGPESPYGRTYDPATVETVSGEVVGVEHFTPRKGMHPGVHLQLKTDKETVDVHLGPSWYVENQDLKIAPKDHIEVKGSKVTFAGKSAIVAREVTKGDETLTLRDQNGVPVWSGWRRR